MADTVTAVRVGTAFVRNDGKYNSFPGVVRCANGDLLAAYRKANSHTVGGAGNGLYTVRSTDNGTTWGAPVLVRANDAYEGGTATLSRLSDNTIALVTWLRPTAGGTPLANGVRIYRSTDNGTTWGAPLTVDTGADLAYYSVSESALVEHTDGYHYLALWGQDTSTSLDYSAGVWRSLDLSTWTRVATFDTGTTNGFNETGVGVVGGRLVAIIRNEADKCHYSSTSSDGVTWSTPKLRRSGTGPAKMGATFGGFGFAVLRDGDFPGPAYLASVARSGKLTFLSDYSSSLNMMYGQAVMVDATTLGTMWCAQSSSSNSYLLWSTFNLTLVPGPPLPELAVGGGDVSAAFLGSAEVAAMYVGSTPIFTT